MEIKRIISLPPSSSMSFLCVTEAESWLADGWEGGRNVVAGNELCARVAAAEYGCQLIHIFKKGLEKQKCYHHQPIIFLYT